ncbi:hypothetical protein LSTR_LSTR007858 [Laodelphax striatellus]|uniref:Uncharacterized protein n=1 Tax=Laodelphax striatellus TaxID=195883 RepID=A0A482WPE6_LAOST|nr:hypothetical protein LSTR_LSTR007858 [Laodelphax striatellus]
MESVDQGSRDCNHAPFTYLVTRVTAYANWATLVQQLGNLVAWHGNTWIGKSPAQHPAIMKHQIVNRHMDTG